VRYRGAVAAGLAHAQRGQSSRQGPFAEGEKFFGFPGLEAPGGATPVEQFADGVGWLLAAHATVSGDDLLNEPQLGDAKDSVGELEAAVRVFQPHLTIRYNPRLKMFSGFSSPHDSTR
jgi:hypothetical protein